MKTCFHQYVIVEKGPVNAVIVDLLRGRIFHVDNNLFDRVEDIRGDPSSAASETEALIAQGLMIRVPRDTWIPPLSLSTEYILSEMRLRLDIEEGSDLTLIATLLRDVPIASVAYYGSRLPSTHFLGKPMLLRSADFEECARRSTISGQFPRTRERDYRFNRMFNTCWGLRFAMTRHGDVRPCLYSGVVLGRLGVDTLANLVSAAWPYWTLTKDKVDGCRHCELRYVCIDCREIAIRTRGHSLHSKNPNCSYDPGKGVFQ